MNNSIYDEKVNALAKKKLAVIQQEMLLTRRRIQANFDNWLKTMDPNDPINVEILRRLSIFDRKIQSWKDLGEKNDRERQKALDFIR